jgi:peptidoglycan/xylan/chitin deacetylase (PgdA/CDA1 family)
MITRSPKAAGLPESGQPEVNPVSGEAPAQLPSGRAPAAARRPARLFILNFHGLGIPRRELPTSERELWSDPSRFQLILDIVKGRSEIRLTFDDANESDYSIALPELKARHLTAQFFVVTDRIGQAGYLSRRQIEALVADGMAVGNHGLRHRRWTGLNESELQEELVEARDRLEQIAGRPIPAAACPFGSYNRRVIRALQVAGYRNVYTSDGGPAWENAWILPRNSIRHSQDIATIASLGLDEPGWLHRAWRAASRLLKRWR